MRVPALSAALVVWLAACTGTGGTDAPDPAASSAPADTAADTTDIPVTTVAALAPGQVAHPIGASFQYGATLVTLGDLVYDAGTQRAMLGVRLQNLSSGWVFPELASELEQGGTVALGSYTAMDLPPGLTIDTTVEFAGLTADPTDPAAGGVLRWGRPDRSRPTVDLASGTVQDAHLPQELPIDGWLSIGRYSVRLTEAQLLAGSLGLNQQSLDDEQVLRLGFDVFTAVQDPVNGFYPAEHLTMAWPDASIGEALASSDGFAPVSWTTTSGNWVEFSVPAGATRAELRLSSISPMSMGALFPDLIERVSLPVDLAADGTGVWAKAVVGGPLPRPTPAPSPATDDLTVPVDVEGINAPGFWVRPTDLRFDPSSATVELDLEATSLTLPAEAFEVTDQVGEVVGLLDTDPIFSFTIALATSGRLYSGSISGDASVPAGETRTFTVTFGAVTAFDLDDLGLLLGTRSGHAASVPIGPGSPLPRYPQRPEQRAISAEPATADHWTAQLVSYRLGTFSTVAPPPGTRELEVLVDVTAAADSPLKALGLGFRGSVQLFMESPDGYLIQPVADNRYVAFEPGDTHRIPVLFRVPEGFVPGTYRFVLRGADETADVTTTVWTETSVAADLGSSPVVADSAKEELR